MKMMGQSDKQLKISESEYLKGRDSVKELVVDGKIP
jgi:hypothetical protein